MVLLFNNLFYFYVIYDYKKIKMSKALNDLINKKLVENISNSINLKSIDSKMFGGKTFQLDIQNKILGDIQGGLFKKSLGDIKLNIQNTVNSKYTDYRQGMIDEITDPNSNLSDYFKSDDISELNRTASESGKSINQVIRENFPEKIDLGTNVDDLASNIKNTNFAELDPDINKIVDDLRNDPEVKGEGIGSGRDTDLETFIDNYKIDSPPKRAKDETLDTAKAESKQLVINNGNTKATIAGTVLTIAAVAGLALFIMQNTNEQEADIINIKKIDNETIEIFYNKTMDFCPKTELEVDIPSGILDQPISDTFSSYEVKTDKSVSIKPGFSSSKFPTQNGNYGTIGTKISYGNSLGCVPSYVNKKIVQPALEATGIDKIFKDIINFIKKSGLIIGGVILGIIILYIALKFFVFRGGDSTEIKLVSPSSNARYYYN